VLHINSLSKRFGHQTIFEDLSWHIGLGVRIGLVGPNGAGKTTLLRILSGIESPDSGGVSLPKGMRIGYLPQEVETLEGSTVLGHALSGFGEVREIEEEIERIENALASRPGDDELARLTSRYGDLRHRFEALGGYRIEGEARVILGGLGFGNDQLHAPLTTLSGGWRMRAPWRAICCRRPEILLLDEPTNHPRPRVDGLARNVHGRVRRQPRRGQPRPILPEPRRGRRRGARARAPDALRGDYDDYQVEKESRREALLAAKKNQERQIAQTERFIEVPLQGDQGAPGARAASSASRRSSGSRSREVPRASGSRSPAGALRRETIRVEGNPQGLRREGRLRRRRLHGAAR
jgi:ATP-binding cassette subfamily F protein 3